MCPTLCDTTIQESPEHGLCTVLYDYDYNLSIEIHNSRHGTNSIANVSPAKLRSVKGLRLEILEDKVSSPTQYSSCASASVDFHAGGSASLPTSENEEKKTESGLGLTNSYTEFNKNLWEIKSCEDEETKPPEPDQSKKPSYIVNLDVIRPGDSEFKKIYDNLVNGFKDSNGVKRPPLAKPETVPSAPSHGDNHDDFAKVVCLTRITSKDLDDGLLDGFEEINVGLTSSNFGSKLESFWPRKVSDCPPGSKFGDDTDKRRRTCQIPVKSGGLNVSNLCISMPDKNFVLGVRIREIDDWSNDEFSMTTIKAAELLPKMSSLGEPLTDQ